MKDKTYDLLVECELQLNDTADLIAEYVKEDCKSRHDAVRTAALDLIKERRLLINLSKKIHQHLVKEEKTKAGCVIK